MKIFNNFFQKYKNSLIFYIFSFLFSFVIVNGELNMSKSNNDQYDFTLPHVKMMDFMSDRTIVFSENSIDQRKKFRWLYKKIEVSLYSFFANFNSIKLNKYIYLFHYSLILFFSLIFSTLLYESLAQKAGVQTKITAFVIFYLVYLVVSLIGGFNETFVYIETLSILMALYSSIKRKKILFVLSVLIGVSNRETGMALGLIYPIVNFKNISYKQMAVFMLIPPIFFTIVNIDIIQHFFALIFYSDLGEGRPTLLNLPTLLTLGVGELINTLIIYFLFFLPLAYMIRILNRRVEVGWLKYISLLYATIILFGSYFGNFILLLLFLPVYISATALVNKYYNT